MHSVREFCELAFSHAGLCYEDHVVQNPIYLRAAEVHELCGDATKARNELGWNPRVKFSELVAMMVESDLKLAAEEKKLGRFISLY